MDTEAESITWLLWTVSPSMQPHKHLRGQLTWTGLRKVQLDHMVILLLVLWGTSTLISTSAVYKGFFLPTSSHYMQKTVLEAMKTKESTWPDQDQKGNEFQVLTMFAATAVFASPPAA